MRISDWSSDVCSSDLHRAGPTQHSSAHPIMLLAREGVRFEHVEPDLPGIAHRVEQPHRHGDKGAIILGASLDEEHAVFAASTEPEIGRASCRERVCQYG